MQVENLIERSQGILVAVSGGADSVALLHMLVSHGYTCTAAHCNFHLRADESDRDEAFVRELCSKMNVALHVQHFNTQAYAAEHSVSIEMAARELRYNWFFSLLDELHLQGVAVAHHADDAAETFLLNLVRGTGIRGLSGMKAKQNRVLRPMLGISRSEVEMYCRAHHLQYVTDSSNASDDYTRNRLRHHVVPQLKSINPSFLRTMQSNMHHLSQVAEVFAQQVEAFVNQAVRRSGQDVFIDIKQLQSLSVAEPYIFEILSPLGFSADNISRIARCVAQKRWGREFHAGNRRVVVDRQNIIVTTQRTDSQSMEVTIDEAQDELSAPIRLKMKRLPRTDDFAISRAKDIAHLDASKLTFPLKLRKWQRGDVFRPLGMKGTKKLSDYFVDSKMSLTQKENAWVLESNGKIAWVVGLRLDERVKVEPSTKEIYEVQLLDRQ